MFIDHARRQGWIACSNRPGVTPPTPVNLRVVYIIIPCLKLCPT